MTYRNKLMYEAFQLTADNIFKISAWPHWMQDAVFTEEIEKSIDAGDNKALAINTLQGDVMAKVQDYIVYNEVEGFKVYKWKTFSKIFDQLCEERHA